MGPDLTGVLPDPTTNTITYTEDQAIIGGAPNPASFTFTRSGGTGLPRVPRRPSSRQPGHRHVHAGRHLPGERRGPRRSELRCSPQGSPPPPIRRIPTHAGSGDRAGDHRHDRASGPHWHDDSNPTSRRSTTRSTRTCRSINQLGFRAVLSNGGVVGLDVGERDQHELHLDDAPRHLPGPHPVAVEYMVKAGVIAGAVRESSPPHNANQIERRPRAATAARSARGFTTGPDVFSATINTTTGVVTLGLDQRIFARHSGADQPARLER